MEHSGSRNIIKSLQKSMSSEKDVKKSISKNKIKKKKRLKSKRSEASLSKQRDGSDSGRSTQLAGNSSSFLAPNSTDIDTEVSISETSISSKSKAHKRDKSMDKPPVSSSSLGKSKKKSERVVVHVRMRPFNKAETEKGKKTSISRFDQESNLISVYKDKSEGIKSKFYFDSLFPDDVTQEEVYETTGRRVVESVINGFNGTIFAYGQTGTGKTFTMLGDYLSKGGDNTKMGIIPRSLDQIFQEWNALENEFSFEVSVSFTQIYMEMIQDLLEPSNTELRIREDMVNGVYISGVLWIPVKNVKQAMKVFSLGEK